MRIKSGGLKILQKCIIWHYYNFSQDISEESFKRVLHEVFCGYADMYLLYWYSRIHRSLIHHLNVKIFLYFLSGCQNGLLYVWTLPQGGANVSVPNFLTPSTSQDKSSAIKVRFIYLSVFFCVCGG